MLVALQNVCWGQTRSLLADQPVSWDLMEQTHFHLPSFKVTAVIKGQSVELIFTI